MGICIQASTKKQGDFHITFTFVASVKTQHVFPLSMNSSLFTLQDKTQRIIPYPAFLASWTSSTKPPVVKLQAPKKCVPLAHKFHHIFHLKSSGCTWAKYFMLQAKILRSTKSRERKGIPSLNKQPLPTFNHCLYIICIHIYDLWPIPSCGFHVASLLCKTKDSSNSSPHPQENRQS